MLFIVIVVVFILYCGLYLLWEAAQTELQGTAAILRAINNMLLMPQETVFVILRGLLIIAFFYVIADFFFHSAKRGLKRKNKEPKTLQATFKEDPNQSTIS